MRRPAPEGRPVVVKIGSSSLTGADGRLDRDRIADVAAQAAELAMRGRPPVVVTSGAVAAGLPALGMAERPRDLASLQAAAAVGQGRLMEAYTVELARRGLVAGQVLLTKDVLANRDPYLHARQAMERMVALGVVPVVNENDTVAVEELRLGDNDRLAAIVAHLVSAGMLVILTDTPGLLSADPRLDPGARLLDAVRHTDEVLDVLARGGSGPLGSGGIATKVAAARMAAWSGIPTVVASAAEAGAAVRASMGEEVGTWVEPQPRSLPARKLWIAFGQPANGRIVVDDGAAEAIVRHGRSLLPVGVRQVDGDFDVGDAVEVVDDRGRLIAKGLVLVDAATVREAAGRRSSELAGEGWGRAEVIHRDDLVVLVADAADALEDAPTR